MKFSLRDFDILGLSPSLYVESQKRKLSLIGGIMSILTVIFLLIFITYFICEVFVRNSFVLISNQTTDSTPYLNLTKMPLAIGFYDKNANLIPSSEIEGHIRIFAEIIHMDKDPLRTGLIKLSTQRFSLEKCNINTHFENYSDLFYNRPRINEYYCIPNEKQNLTLYGNWADAANPNSFLVIRMTKCLMTAMPEEFSDVLPRRECANKTKIDETFSNFFANILLLDYDLEHKDFDNPGKLRGRSESLIFSTSVFNLYHFKQKIVRYVTEFGFIFSNVRNEVFFQDESIAINTDLRVNNSPIGIFGHITFSLSKKTDNYYRNYHKLQSALANIGGLVQGIWFVLSALVYFLTKKGYYNDIGKKCDKISITENSKRNSINTNSLNFNFNRFGKNGFNFCNSKSLNQNFASGNYFNNHADCGYNALCNENAPIIYDKKFMNDNDNYNNKNNRITKDKNIIEESKFQNTFEIERGNIRKIHFRKKSWAKQINAIQKIDEDDEENKSMGYSALKIKDLINGSEPAIQNLNNSSNNCSNISLLPEIQGDNNVTRIPYLSNLKDESKKKFKRHSINVVNHRPNLLNLNQRNLCDSHLNNNIPGNFKKHINNNNNNEISFINKSKKRKSNFLETKFEALKSVSKITSSCNNNLHSNDIIDNINNINNNNNYNFQNEDYSTNNMGFRSFQKLHEISNKTKSKGERKKKNLFGYSICFWWSTKNYYFKKLQGLIRRDLSVENILYVINSHEIIKNILKEKNILEIDTKPNFFDKINKLNWRDSIEIPLSVNEENSNINEIQ